VSIDSCVYWNVSWNVSGGISRDEPIDCSVLEEVSRLYRYISECHCVQIPWTLQDIFSSEWSLTLEGD